MYLANILARGVIVSDHPINRVATLPDGSRKIKVLSKLAFKMATELNFGTQIVLRGESFHIADPTTLEMYSDEHDDHLYSDEKQHFILLLTSYYK